MSVHVEPRCFGQVIVTCKFLGFPNGVCDKRACNSLVSIEPCRLKLPSLQSPLMNLEKFILEGRGVSS